jgi:hypothetical protein
MSVPRADTETPIRVGEKQARVADGNRRVAVIDAMGRLVVIVHEPSAIARYLSAQNAEPVRDRRGQLRAIKLASLADDRGNRGEHHGSSLVTTERCKNQRGEYVGPPTTIKHKLDRSDAR